LPSVCQALARRSGLPSAVHDIHEMSTTYIRNKIGCRVARQNSAEGRLLSFVHGIFRRFLPLFEKKVSNHHISRILVEMDTYILEDDFLDLRQLQSRVFLPDSRDLSVFICLCRPSALVFNTTRNHHAAAHLERSFSSSLRVRIRTVRSTRTR
jgi:hypothetical protein